MLFNQLGELLGDDVIEGIVAVVESYEGPVDLQDVQQSLEEVSSKFAVLSQAEKDRFTRQLCETVRVMHLKYCTKLYCIRLVAKRTDRFREICACSVTSTLLPQVKRRDGDETSDQDPSNK